MRIDLHTHSTASDGTTPPGELMAQARAAGLDVIGLTDHDTTAAWAVAAEALPSGLALVPGAEISCVHGPIATHLLAYLFDPLEPVFAAARADLRRSRAGRGREIVDRMAADGLPISWDAVASLAAGAPVGRPHVARALVAAGVVGSVEEAFGKLLHVSSPYYVRKRDLDVLAAIELVRRAGGVTVFAHPLGRCRGHVVGDEVFAELAEAGLTGIEVDHPDHAPADRAHLRDVASSLGLVATGASDFHGSIKMTRLGDGLTAVSAYERLVDQATGGSPIVG